MVSYEGENIVGELHPILEKLKGKLIVSCQALEGEPLHRSEGGVMVLMAKAALEAGAGGIRAEGVVDIGQIKARFKNVPIIGIIKRSYPNYASYITATMKEVDELVAVGSDIIALDATLQERGDGQTVNVFVKQIKTKYPEQLLMADISTLEEGLNAAEIGFDLIGTTMNGYTPYTETQTEVNFELMKNLVEQTKIPIVAEGKIHTPEDLAKAFDQGVFTAVVGGAITRPKDIARRFIQAIQ